MIILEHDPDNWNKPKLHKGAKVDWDEDDSDYQRYYDTFHVAQFNPRWKYGTASYVEVIDLDDEGITNPTHLWTDEQVADMKAKGIITEEMDKCTVCHKTLANNETGICDDCIPF